MSTPGAYAEDDFAFPSVTCEGTDSFTVTAKALFDNSFDAVQVQVWDLVLGVPGSALELATTDDELWSVSATSSELGVGCSDAWAAFTFEGSSDGLQVEPEGFSTPEFNSTWTHSDADGLYFNAYDTRGEDAFWAWLIYPDEDALYGPFELTYQGEYLGYPHYMSDTIDMNGLGLAKQGYLEGWVACSGGELLGAAAN